MTMDRAALRAEPVQCFVEVPNAAPGPLERPHAQEQALDVRVLGCLPDPLQDVVVFREYLETVVKERSDWADLYRACREHV